MRSSLYNFSLLKNTNHISVSNGGESVSNNNYCLHTLLDQSIKCFLDLVFTICVQSGGSLIKKKDSWLSNKSSCYCDPLLLTTGEFDSSFTNEGVIHVRESLFIMNKIIGVGFSASFINVCFGNFIFVKSVADVGADGSSEQAWFLRNDTDLILIPFGVEIFDI